MARTDPPLERVRRFALALPDVEEGTTFGYPAFKVAGKTFAWFPRKKEVESDSLAVRMSLPERDDRIATSPDVHYVTPHYQNYPAVLVRVWLLADRDLIELLRSAHTLMAAQPAAPKRKRR